MTTLVVFRPDLPPALRRQVDRLNAGPTRYPSRDDTPDLVVPVAPPSFHPDAQQHADAMRQAAEPADQKVIEQWFLLLATSIAGAPTPGGQDYSNRLRALRLVCGKLPSACWSEGTLVEAVAKFTFWPSIAEIDALMRPHADQLTATLRALERIANGDHVRVSNRPSTTYDPGPPPDWVGRRTGHPSMPTHEDPAGNLVRIDPQEVERQLAMLGVKDHPKPHAEPARQTVDADA